MSSDTSKEFDPCAKRDSGHYTNTLPIMPQKYCRLSLIQRNMVPVTHGLPQRVMAKANIRRIKAAELKIPQNFSLLDLIPITFNLAVVVIVNTLIMSQGR